MKTFAYCAASFVDSARKAAGVEPLTCPPINVNNFDTGWLEGVKFIYLDLHGLPGKGYWFEMVQDPEPRQVVAMTAAKMRQCNIEGATVFASTCYLADKGSPMMTALFDAGARCVVGGDGENWAGRTRQLFGADLLGQKFRFWTSIGMSPTKALAYSKKSVFKLLEKERAAGNTKRALAARDTLDFRVYYKERKK